MNTQNIETKQKKGQKKQEASNPLYFLPQPEISITYLQAFENCPFNFYLKNYVGVEWPLPERMRLGVLFQNALNAKVQSLPYADIINEIEEPERAIAKVLIEEASDFNDVISIDTPYTIDFGLGIPVRFTPDLLTKSMIVENKTTRGYYNQSMVEKEKQATVYHTGVKKLFGYDLPIIYQIFNFKTKTYKAVGITKEQKDIDEILIWFDTTLHRIEKCYNSGNWDIGKHSYFKCDLGDACPLYKRYAKTFGRKNLTNQTSTTIDIGF